MGIGRPRDLDANNHYPGGCPQAAQAAKSECEKRGWQVTVEVADPAGLPLVVLRSRYAGWHTVEAATGKARTAASWRESTSNVAARVTKPDAAEKGVMNLPGVVMIGGGLPIEAAGRLSARSVFRGRRAVPMTIFVPRPALPPSRAIWLFECRPDS